MFIDASDRIEGNAPGLHYGMAVVDADGDGRAEVFVTGFGEPNRTPVILPRKPPPLDLASMLTQLLECPQTAFNRPPGDSAAMAWGDDD